MKKVITLMAAMLLAATTLTAKERIVKSDREFSPNHHSSTTVASKELWDILGTFNTQVAAFQAVATDGTYIYTTKWSGTGDFEKYDMDGTFVEAFTIAGAAAIRDFAYDGEYFYGSAAGTTMFKIDMETQSLVESISVSGVDGIRHLTYSPDTDTFWGGNWASLYEFNRTGSVLQSVSGIENAYGSAYDPYSAGGPFLWIFHQGGSGAVIAQFDIASSAYTGVSYDCIANVPGTVAGTSIAGGAEATELYTPGKFALLANIQQDPNMIVAFELCDTAPEDAPGAPTNFTAVPGSMGALTADLDWTNPSVTAGGAALTELTEVKVFRNGTEINSVNNPVVGSAGSYMDNAAVAGMNAYVVKTYNTAGEGLSASANIWCGPDAPGALENLTLVQTAPGEMSGTLTWTNPTVGAHGGYLAGIDGYTIIRNDGQEFYLDGEATTYVDATIQNSGNYNYTVIPENEAGEGTASISNTVFIGGANIVLMEGFETFPPAGWSTVGGSNWMGAASNNAGGTAPEAQFNWNPSTVGDQYMITPALDVTGAETATVTFKHMVNHYGPGYDLKLVYSSDMTNWTEAWSITPAASVPAEELTFDIPVTSNTLYVAWLFSGDSYQINYWYVDDVMIEKGGPNPFLPPTNAVATLNGTNNIDITWTAPNGGGSGEIVELIYDQGEVEDGYQWVGATMSSRMSPAEAGKILTLKYFITSGTGNFNAEVYDWAGTQPGDMMATYPATGVENDWVEIDVSADNIMFDGDFNVGFGSIEAGTYMGFNTVNNGRAWDFDGTSWAPWSETYFIRAVVQYNGGDVVELGVKNQNFASSYPELKAGKEKSGNYIPQQPMSTKDDVLYYKIYRNGTYLAQSNTTSYTDTGLATGTYTYGISAVYDGGESNQAISNDVNVPPVGGGVWLGYGVEFTGSALAYDGSTAFDIALDFDLGDDYISKVLKIKAAGGAGYVNPWKIVEFNGTMTNTLPVISGLEGTIETLGKDGDLYIENEIDVNVDCLIENPFAIVLSVPAMTTQIDENYFAAEIDVPNSVHSWIQSTPNGLSWAQLSNYAGLEYIWNLSALVELNGGAVVELLPGSTTLAQNYPNPFNPTTSINFYSNMSGKVELSVYNSNGELVSTLVNGNMNAGNHTVMFDASNLNSGVYFYTLTSPTKTITKKMVLVK
ncbi:MAG: choice-of-anchor J domain-containing protein [Candidatus Delongbacteria bacterium]|nr:choice-of-anchor J domain-containing protein [Candidatus Delongbacteria bacterium]MBN2834450.1 choice-of-anchor J domain-containing protein [Candidatus Delongbacteria bacterium]